MKRSVPMRVEMRRSFGLASARRAQLLFAMLSVVLVGLVADRACGETWAERLGYPADKKIVILHAHEMGMCQATNAAAEQLQASGLMHSTSAMAPCPWFSDYATTVSEQQADVGLELTLNSEWTNYRWQPMALDGKVTSLVDSRGYLWSTSVQTMVNGSTADVEHEMFVQIVRAQLAGVRPTHLTTHLGTLFTRLDFAKIYLRMAREHWIPAVVVELTPEHVENFQRMGFPIPPELVGLIAEYPLPKVDELVFIPRAESYEEKKQAFMGLIEGLKPGLTQVAFHPAVESEEIKRIAPDWQEKVWEAQLFQDQEVRDLLESDPVILTTWREIMQRFEGEAPAEIEMGAADQTP